MNEMVNYIFGNLRASDDTIRRIKGVLRRQKRLNNAITTCILTLIIWAIVFDINNQKLDKKIQELKNEIKELKHTKGE